jgi:hypothetical protein
MAAGRDRDLLWPIKTRRNDEMNLPAMKTSVLPRIGLRRGVPTALALVATLALGSSAQAQTTYTWTGTGTSNNWFTDATTFASDNFSSTPLVSSLTTTDLVFAGSTRPSSLFNLTGSGTAFNARSLTFNTSVPFTITGTGLGTNRPLNIGLGGIDNQVALKQTWNQPSTNGVGALRITNSGTTPIHVVSGGELDLNARFTSVGAGVFVEKTGAGTLTFSNPNSLTIDNLIVSSGTVNSITSNLNTRVSADVRGGVLNVFSSSYEDFSTGSSSYYRQSAGVANLGNVISAASFDLTGGTFNSGDVGLNYGGQIASKTTISGGTFNHAGPAGEGVLFTPFSDRSGFSTVAPTVTITGGVQNFGAGVFDASSDAGPAVVVSGGVSTGFYDTEGVTNNGGSITFTAKASNAPATNGVGLGPGPGLLTFTSGTVSIGTVAGGATAIGSLKNTTNTFLGAGNTLNLDFNQDLTRDLLITSGTLNWDGIVALNLTNSGTIANGTSWNFFNDGVLGNTGAFTGTLDGISLTASSIYTGLAFSKSGSLWTSTATGGGQQFTFNETTGVLALVPEPSSTAAVGIGLAMLGWRRLARRRRAAA